MAGQVTVGVIAKQPGLDLDTRKAKALRRKLGHFFVTQTGTDRQGLKTTRFLHQFLEAATVSRLNVHYLGQCVNGFFQGARFGRCDFQCIRRIVGCQHDAVAIQNQTPVRYDRDDCRAVTFGLFVQVLVPMNLQVQQTTEQQKESQEHQRACHDDPQSKAVQI